MPKRRPVKRAISPEIELKARELMRHIELLADQILSEIGDLSRREAAVLRFLERNGPASMSEISSAVGLALSTTTGLIDRLVERNLVGRDRPAGDRRTVIAVLTTRGRREYGRFVASRVSFGASILEALDRRERESLLEMFRKITAGIEK